MESVSSKPADSAAGGRRSGIGAVLLLVILGGGSGVLNKGLTRPLLDLVTLVGVAAGTGRGGSLLDDRRLLTLLPELHVCLRGEEGTGWWVVVLRGVGGREME